MNTKKCNYCQITDHFYSHSDNNLPFSNKKIRKALSKHKSDLTTDDEQLLKKYKHIVRLVESQKHYQTLKKERELEIEDDPSLLAGKCSQLVDLIRASKFIVVYTGAGISTSASIPDYRGPNGIWTQLKNGLNTPKVNDLVFAEPTFTHMALVELVQLGIVQHIVSQNCDGLHLRSGIPTQRLSEIHGNMYVEVCKSCKAHYLRSFDCTEKTALRRHDTGRLCHRCEGPLMDTIVHFGEKGKLKYPLNWEAASEAVEKADLIICIGSSLKVLRKYQCLWPKKKSKAKLAIINLQWTPKDSQANLKINGKCDLVVNHIMAALNVTPRSYERLNDSIFCQNVPLRDDEESTCNRVKLDHLVNAQTDASKFKLSPGWFGKGIKKK